MKWNLLPFWRKRDRKVIPIESHPRFWRHEHINWGPYRKGGTYHWRADVGVICRPPTGGDAA